MKKRRSHSDCRSVTVFKGLCLHVRRKSLRCFQWTVIVIVLVLLFCNTKKRPWGSCIIDASKETAAKVRSCGEKLVPLVPGSFRPQQTSLTFYGKAGEMGVSWVTFDGAQHDHYVEVKRMSSSPTAPSPEWDSFRVHPSVCHVFLPRINDCRFSLLHATNLTGLTPGALYSYYIFSGHVSREFSFRAGRGPNERWTFLVFGDVGLTREGGGIVGPMIGEQAYEDYDAMLTVGDYAYNLAQEIGKGEFKADDFKREIEPLSSRMPFMMTPGNHDGWPEIPAFYHYMWRFRLPGVWPDFNKNFRYSVDFGSIHAVFINTEQLYDGVHRNVTPASAAGAVAWLKQDLTAFVRKRFTERPWILVFGHVTPYCHGNDIRSIRLLCEDVTEKVNPVRRAIEAELKAFGVDVAFWGDVHIYERTYPVYDGRRRDKGGDISFHEYVDPPATVHVVNGVGGSPLYSDTIWTPGGSATPLKLKIKEWSAFRSRDVGFGRLVVYNASHLSYEQISVEDCPMVDEDIGVAPCQERNLPEIIDHFWIVRRNASRWHRENSSSGSSEI